MITTLADFKALYDSFPTEPNGSTADAFGVELTKVDAQHIRLRAAISASFMGLTQLTTRNTLGTMGTPTDPPILVKESTIELPSTSQALLEVMHLVLCSAMAGDPFKVFREILDPTPPPNPAGPLIPSPWVHEPLYPHGPTIYRGPAVEPPMYIGDPPQQPGPFIMPTVWKNPTAADVPPKNPGAIS